MVERDKLACEHDKDYTERDKKTAQHDKPEDPILTTHNLYNVQTILYR